MQVSYWEQDSMTRAYCVVIGAGLVGLQTALALRKRLPAARIVVFERGILPAGASTRNAGFACFGSLTEILADIDTAGVVATLDLIEQRWRGLALLRNTLGDQTIGYEGFGGHELIRFTEQSALARLGEVNELLLPLFGKLVFSVRPDGPAAAGFGPDVLALVSNSMEGQLHSGKTMQALQGLARRQNIDIITGAQVERLEEDAEGVNLVLSGGARFWAERVAVCTNALIPALLPSLPIVPGRGQVLVTEPLADLPFRGCFHIDRGYFYFRNVGNRVLLGGGRNLDPTTETTTDIALSAPIQQALEKLLAETILPGRKFQIASRWAGLMGFTQNKQPRVERTSERVVAGFGCNGMGVALSPLVAAQAARLLAER
ncbi:FAD-binding oxidoreductase [Lacisediminimonas sp.]|uniref:NAD(P)/FAD-dependent oxidoreductase n=1 Tax=Lacisediminimonas sp. TaxID=3060582 RepID=UPI0027269462|nr:FAD-dependent oxidoreductase [Lacisediminimonas sp.]MDO8298385.1 FAD-dependent oxidoreductase [Lacisediminimonas sp.]